MDTLAMVLAMADGVSPEEAAAALNAYTEEHAADIAAEIAGESVATVDETLAYLGFN